MRLQATSPHENLVGVPGVLGLTTNEMFMMTHDFIWVYHTYTIES